MMENEQLNLKNAEQLIIRKCHHCGQIAESSKELDKCVKCQKPFLPTNYFEKIHAHKKSTEVDKLYSNSNELSEEELVKGIFVLW